MDDKGEPDLVQDVAVAVDPFLRSVAFCKEFRPRQRAKDGIREASQLTYHTVLRLVQQHLAVHGWERALQMLEDERFKVCRHLRRH